MVTIIAHRCRGFGFPENSIRAIRAALTAPIDAIEIDIRLTKDHKWVAIHNPFYTNEKRSVQHVHDHTLAKVKREVVPLDMVLALFSALGEGKELFIDVKDVGEARGLVRLLKRHKVLERTIVIAWEPEILKRVHKEEPQLRLGFSYVPIFERLRDMSGTLQKPLSKHGILLHFNELHSFDRRFPIGKTHQHYLSELPDLPLYSIQVFGLLCSSNLVERAHKKRLKVYPFTVNNKLTARLLRGRNVDGFLTDDAKAFTSSAE